MLTLALDRRVKSARDIPGWQDELRKRVVELLNLPRKVLDGRPPAYTVLERSQREGYEQCKVSYLSFDGETVLAWMLTPAPASMAAKHPCILVLHGHGQGARSAIGEVPSQDGQLAVAKTLAQSGYAVAVPELRTFGERTLPAVPNPSNKTAHELYANYCMALGRPLLMLHLAEALPAAYLLMSWDNVAGDRLGVAGLSQGGRLAALAAGLDQRFKACLVASGLSTATKAYGGYCHLHDELVGLLRYVDYPDLTSLVAPRPLLLTYGSQEWGPYAMEAGQGLSYNQIRKAYRWFGAEEKVQQQVHSGGHTYDFQGLLDFFASNL
jgi:dienelactone hydrolase